MEAPGLALRVGWGYQLEGTDGAYYLCPRCKPDWNCEQQQGGDD